MSRLNCRILLAFVALSVVGFAAVAQAEVLYDYNFNTLNNGALQGQDGWYLSSASGGVNVTNTPATGWDGKYAEATLDSQQVYRHALTNTLVDNQSFDVSVVVRADSTMKYKAWLGFYWFDTFPTPTALDNSIGIGCTGTGYYWSANIGTNMYIPAKYVVPTVTDSAVRVGIAYTALGDDDWSVQPYYQVFGGDIVNVGTAITLNDYQPSTANAKAWNCYQFVPITAGSRLDDILITQVPEPSTLALLACGLLGLLAYAWRKRK